MKTKLLLCIVLLLVTIESKASDNSIILGGWSYHLVADDTTNSNHKMFGYQYNNWITSYFKNSYDNDSFFGGYSILQYEDSLFKAELLAGVVTGYDYCLGTKLNWCPVVIPTLTINTSDNFKPQFILLGDAVVVALRIDI